MNKFWNWTVTNNDEKTERILTLSGVIAEESWFDDEVTPKIFRDELMSGEGDITVWINSPGGDCIAAAQIYNMLLEYKGNVTIKIDGIAASAASVVAMAGNKVIMSPVSMLMIHNPMTMAAGDTIEMKKAISMLTEVKESIINAYELRTGLSRTKLSHLMDEETWMNANKAIELGFADDTLKDEKLTAEIPAYAFSGKAVQQTLVNKITAKARPKPPAQPEPTAKHTPPAKPETSTGRSVNELMERLNLLKY